MLPKRLTPTEWRQRAEPAMRRVFRTLELTEGPFTDEMNHRIILDTDDDYFLSPAQFEAICMGAREVGDESLFFSVVRGYTSGQEHMPYQTWELPLFGYDTYISAEDIDFPEGASVTRPKEIEGDIALERILYSPSGKWGVFTPEVFALVGGSAIFMDELKRGYPQWHDDLKLFFERRQKAASKGSENLSWVRSILHHMYSNRAAELLS